jgi:hypothetical protein
VKEAKHKRKKEQENGFLCYRYAGTQPHDSKCKTVTISHFANGSGVYPVVAAAAAA